MSDFRTSVLRTANTDFKSVRSRLSPELNLVLLNATLGLVGESGEFADMIKKNLMHGKDLDIEKAINELGDIRYYLELAAYALGTTMEYVEMMNVDKLQKRYPNGFTTQDSIQRADEENVKESGAI